MEGDVIDSGITKHVSLPPSSWLWRNCPRRSSNSKKLCPSPHLYGPVSHPLGVSVPLLKREDTHQMPLYGFTCVTLVCELQGKTITLGGLYRKDALPVSSERFLRQKSGSTDFMFDLNRVNFD